MANSDLSISVTGLKELRSALRQVDADFPKELRLANKAAADVVVVEAKRRGGQGRPNLAGGMARLGSRGVGSIRSLAQQTSAQVAGGSASIAWFGGNEFGSGGAYRQFPSRSADGYILWPSVIAKRDQVVETYNEMLGDLLKEAFPD